MLDYWARKIVEAPLRQVAEVLRRRGWQADRLTLLSLAVGLVALPALVAGNHLLALLCIAANRIGDGLDGTLARLEGASDAGAFLDIVCDFVFYGAVVFGFALADPAANALAAAALLTAILINGSSFLAFAVFAERRKIIPVKQPAKGLYYLGGVAEGTETIFFFLLCGLFPGLFAYFAWIFAGLCLLSGISRLVGGYLLLR